MAIITYENWYALTKETFNWRGAELTAVDKALKAYHHKPTSTETVKQLRDALVAYQAYLAKKNAGDWEKSSRNSQGGIKMLIDEVEDKLHGKVSAETLMLRSLLIEHRAQSLVRLFGGRQIVLKPNGKLKQVQAIGGQMGGAISAVKAVITEICRTEQVVEKVPEVIQMLGSEALNHMYKSMIPLMGGISAGISAAAKVADAVSRYFQARGIRNDHMPFVNEGTAAKACEALIELLTRRRNDSLKRAGLYTQQAALQIAGNFFPGGQVVGALSGAATTFGMLAIDVKLAAMEVKEIAKANEILKRRPARLAGSMDLFTAYPLLGANFIHFGNTNDILSVVAREVGTLHWREVVQDVAKHHLKPMKVLATEFIRESRFQVQGLVARPLPPDGFFDKVGNKVTGFVDMVYDKAAHESAKVLNRYMQGEVDGDDFVREAQPWITTAEAKAEITKKAEIELKGRSGWTTDDLPPRARIHLAREVKEAGDRASGKPPSIDELRAWRAKLR